MLCFSGFLMAYNSLTKRMAPFFVKVRTSDIVKTDPVVITDALTQTSTRWQLVREVDDVDVTIYRYRANWDFPNDPNNESVGSNSFDGELLYRMYKDGRMEIEGEMRVARSSTDDETGVSDYYVYLPFAFPEPTPKVGIEWVYGATPDLSMACTVGESTITNMQLNPTLATTEYPFFLKYYVIPNPDGAQSFDTLRKLVEYDDAVKNLEFDEYMDKLPVKISYHGWWKESTEIEVEEPESYTASLMGTYRTNGMTALLSKPDELTAVTVRGLKAKARVYSNGMYTEVNGVRWLYMSLPGTREVGYVPETMVTKL